MLARVAVADEFLGSRVEVLLADLDALSKCGRCRLIQNLDAAAGTARDFDSVESRTSLGAARTDGPHLARRKRISLDRLIAVQLRCRHELLDTVRPSVKLKCVLRNSLLKQRFCCSFTRRRDSSAILTIHSRSSSETSIDASGNNSFARPLTVLLTASMSRPLSAPPKCTRPCSTPTRLAVLKPGPAFAQEVAHQTEVVREVFRRVQLREVPARGVAMNPVHERGVIPHLRRQWAQEMRDALLLLNIDIEVADHDDAAVSADLILAAAELARRHVALHDVHAVLLIEGDARHLVEAHDVVLADKARAGQWRCSRTSWRRSPCRRRSGARRERSAETDGSCPCLVAQVRPGCSSARRTAPCAEAPRALPVH